MSKRARSLSRTRRHLKPNTAYKVILHTGSIKELAGSQGAQWLDHLRRGNLTRVGRSENETLSFTNDPNLARVVDGLMMWEDAERVLQFEAKRTGATTSLARKFVRIPENARMLEAEFLYAEPTLPPAAVGAAFRASATEGAPLFLMKDVQLGDERGSLKLY